MKKVYLFLTFILISNMYAHYSTVSSDIRFWLHQFKEHAEFAGDFTHDPELHAQKLQLINRINILQDEQENDDDTKDEFIKLATDMNKYQKKVMRNVKKEKMDDPIALDLLDHMIKETKYAQQKVNGKKFSEKQEAKFWATEHKGQAQVTEKLLQEAHPNTRLQEQTHDVAESLKKTSDSEKVKSANRKLNAIGECIKKNPAKSTISPKLAQHEQRERYYAQAIFEGFDMENEQ